MSFHSPPDVPWEDLPEPVIPDPQRLGHLAGLIDGEGSITFRPSRKRI